jgi:hypothetical protein
MRRPTTVSISPLSATADTLGAPVGGFQTVLYTLPEIMLMGCSQNRSPQVLRPPELLPFKKSCDHANQGSDNGAGTDYREKW